MAETVVLCASLTACTTSADLACERWQDEVREEYEAAAGGVFRHINLISDEQIAKRAPNRPDGCPIPPSDE